MSPASDLWAWAGDVGLDLVDLRDDPQSNLLLLVLRLHSMQSQYLHHLPHIGVWVQYFYSET